jgi:hypothetical protein
LCSSSRSRLALNGDEQRGKGSGSVGSDPPLPTEGTACGVDELVERERSRLDDESRLACELSPSSVWTRLRASLERLASRTDDRKADGARHLGGGYPSRGYLDMARGHATPPS